MSIIVNLASRDLSSEIPHVEKKSATNYQNPLFWPIWDIISTVTQDVYCDSGKTTVGVILYCVKNLSITVEKDDAPSDVLKLLDENEEVLLYMKQKKYHPAINIESVIVTDRRVILRKPSMLRIKKSYTDYSYADILNVTIDKGVLRSTLKLNLKVDGTDLLVEDIPNEDAQEAFKIIRAGIDQARSRLHE